MTLTLQSSTPAESRPRFSERLLADVERLLPVDHGIGYIKVHAALGSYSPFTVRHVLRELEHRHRAVSRLIEGRHGSPRRVYRRAAL